MTAPMFANLLPWILPAGTGLIVLIVGALLNSKRVVLLTSLAGIVTGLWSTTLLSTLPFSLFSDFIHIDPVAIFFMQVLYLITLVCVLYFYFSLAKECASSEVYCSSLLFALCGMCLVVATTHLAAFFLGLEIFTAALYILIGFYRHRPISQEAAIKYLVLGGLSSAFILFGIGLLYFGFGSLLLYEIARQMSAGTSHTATLFFLSGTIFLFVGACFKLSLVPFHMWAPDVYQGAPIGTASFIATGSKAAIVALVIRYLAFFEEIISVAQILEVIVIFSIIVGNLLALYQRNLKRLLAYSSIAHLGYALVPLCIGGAAARSASLVYLITYLVTVLAAFGFILILDGDETRSGELDRLQGRGRLSPLNSAGLSIAFFSLAGIPMTAGFIGKWSVFQAALTAEAIPLIVSIIIGASLGAFYYLRVVASLYFKEAELMPTRSHRWGLASLLLLVLIGLFYIGLNPNPLLVRSSELAATLPHRDTAEFFSEQCP